MTTSPEPPKEFFRFSDPQTKFLLELVEDHERIIRHKGNSVEDIECKKKVWASIHDQFVSSPRGIPNAPLEKLKKKYQNFLTSCTRNSKKTLRPNNNNNGMMIMMEEEENNCDSLDLLQQQQQQAQLNTTGVVPQQKGKRTLRQDDIVECRKRESKLLCQKYRLECELLKLQIALAEKQLRA